MLFLIIVTIVNTIIIVVRYERLSILPPKVPLISQKGTKPKDQEKVLENEQLKQMTSNWFGTAEEAENCMAEKRE